MKKAFVLVLALVLTMGLAVPAAAVGTASPTAPTTSTTTTAPLPEVTTTEVTAEDGTVIVVEPVEATDTKLAEEEKALTALYEQSIDLDKIAARAAELGLHPATADEIVTVRVPGGDTTEVFDQPEETGVFAQIGEIFRGVFRNVAEYFS